jgi:hypothetical protein
VPFGQDRGHALSDILEAPDLIRLEMRNDLLPRTIKPSAA